MSAIDLDEAERIGKATSSPWQYREWSKYKQLVELPTGDGETEVVAECGCRSDAEFIVFARNHWQHMVDRIRELEKELQEWRDRGCFNE